MVAQWSVDVWVNLETGFFLTHWKRILSSYGNTSTDVWENLETGFSWHICKCIHNSMETFEKIFLISVSVVTNNYIVPLQYIFS